VSWTESIRDWLREIAGSIITEHPDFAQVFEFVFDREMADDVAEVVNA
jgi:hypothetical protein